MLLLGIYWRVQEMHQGQPVQPPVQPPARPRIRQPAQPAIEAPIEIIEISDDEE